MATNDGVNPYASPSESCEETPRRTRWRIIPVVLLSFLGSIGALCAPAMLIVASVQLLKSGRSIPPLLLFATSLYFVSNLVWIGAAWLCWRRKWRWMTVLIVVGYGGNVLAQHVLGEFGLH